LDQLAHDLVDLQRTVVETGERHSTVLERIDGVEGAVREAVGALPDYREHLDRLGRDVAALHETAPPPPPDVDLEPLTHRIEQLANDIAACQAEPPPPPPPPAPELDLTPVTQRVEELLGHLRGDVIALRDTQPDHRDHLDRLANDIAALR